MAERKITVTVELVIRDMTQAEWDEANEGFEWPDDDEPNGPEGWVNGLEGTELPVCLESALNSVDNPEIFAGSGLFVHTERAQVLSIKWDA